MPNKCIPMVGGGFMEISEVDLEFEFEGKSTYMEFHRHCGPSFYHVNIHGEENWIYPDDSERYSTLWESFYNWFNAPEQQHLHFKEGK
ncbi:hypothetical protein VPH5P1C_0111 [Vibrio phage 5P1c]